MNPWEKIALSDYENHMSLGSVYQLQTLNEIMGGQIADCHMESLAILGVAGGNGLEHIAESCIKTVYGIDINSEYINAVEERYAYLGERLKCLCLDIINDCEKLPRADFVIADLFLEYVGYKPFFKALKAMQAKYISCVIQVNGEGNWVSDSPYEKCFDSLNSVHHLITENDLISEMENHNYNFQKQISVPLPNGKKLLRIDFATI